MAAGAIPANSKITFTLTSSYATGDSAYASITVTTNGAPVPGLFSVSPTVGEELTDLFVMSASLWVDTDLPLTYYSFGFYDPVLKTTFNKLQSYSEKTMSQSYLPAGIDANNYTITCSGRIMDSLSAVTEATTAVKVRTRNLPAATIYEMSSSSITASVGSTDGLRQVVSTTTVLLNSVSCASAPN